MPPRYSPNEEPTNGEGTRSRTGAGRTIRMLAAALITLAVVVVFSSATRSRRRGTRD